MTEVAERLTCSGCGDVVATVDEETKQGPCCHNLPRAWTRSRDGLYNGTDGHHHYEDEDEEENEDAAPYCRDCGSTEFVIHLEPLTVETEEGWGDTIFYDFGDADIDRAECAHCGTRPRHLDLEHE